MWQWVVLLLIVLALPAQAAEVHLAWDPNTETDLAGYRAYRGAQSGIYATSVDVGNVTDYVWTVPDGTWFIAVTAYNTVGAESDFSNEVQFVPGLGVIQPAAGVAVLVQGGLLMTEADFLTTEAGERMGI